MEAFLHCFAENNESIISQEHHLIIYKILYHSKFITGNSKFLVSPKAKFQAKAQTQAKLKIKIKPKQNSSEFQTQIQNQNQTQANFKIKFKPKRISKSNEQKKLIRNFFYLSFSRQNHVIGQMQGFFDAFAASDEPVIPQQKDLNFFSNSHKNQKRTKIDKKKSNKNYAN